jgi:kynurenine 3-monooxygenase
MSERKIIIIGAGLAGSLLAIYLARRGFCVAVYESRADMRQAGFVGGRSINLALSDRGIAALREVGLEKALLANAVPMRGRMIHLPDGSTKFLPYSGRKGEYINSISRGGLNTALINEAEKNENVQFFFRRKCVAFDCETGAARFENGEIVTGETVFATDGAGSVVRDAMLAGGVSRFDFSQSWLAHGYKELHIPPAANGDFQIEQNALHIWARGAFMMIALPNFDCSFTCTLFLAHEGENSFAQLVDEKSVMRFFETHFSDAVRLMPDLTKDFFRNPTGNLGTIRCFPWNCGGRCLLLGDAAHAIVPFYGQGMNASFEDCRVLDLLIEKHAAAINWETIFIEFAKQRKPNADAIAAMAEENFYEMRDAVANPIFQRKRELETLLEQRFPDYFSKYSLVTFREDLPYVVAQKRGNLQDEFLMQICAKVETIGELDLAEIARKVKDL